MVCNALCKMHCENVTIERVTEQTSPWVRDELPVRRMSEWHTIRVRAVRESHAAGAGGGEAGPKITRLTSRAGHYADYREKGLFGKHRGIYWFPECQFGDAALGEVVPEYRVA